MNSCFVLGQWENIVEYKDLSTEEQYLELVKWRDEQKMSLWTDLCRHSAGLGHGQVLKWARAHGYDWYSSTCAVAARNGHLEVLQWARTNGCDWQSSTCAFAAQNGH